jgi:hypothetical protein
MSRKKLLKARVKRQTGGTNVGDPVRGGKKAK